MKETKKQRITRLANMVYDPRSCALCGGTGTLHGKRKGTRNSGCAQCLVRSSRTSVGNEDLLWLILEAAESILPKKAGTR